MAASVSQSKKVMKLENIEPAFATHIRHRAGLKAHHDDSAQNRSVIV